MEEPMLDEYQITMIIRVAQYEIRPSKWDFTKLLDLSTGIGEQAWVTNEKLLRSGTESELEEEYGEHDCSDNDRPCDSCLTRNLPVFDGE